MSPAPPRAAAMPAPSAMPVAVPPQLAGMQYLYGSGEAAAISRQAWAALVDYVDKESHVSLRCAGCRRSVVLTPNATLADPKFLWCGSRPLAAVFDVDETVLLNLGVEADDLTRGSAPMAAARFDRFEETGGDAVVPTPGAKDALDRLRALGVTVIFNTNRSAAHAAATAAAIEHAGLGPATHGGTLFLRGDDATGSRKDGRRATIAQRFCVVAMAGDQLGDFSDLFNGAGGPRPAPAARRQMTALPAVAALWGHGWFVMPNPVYGTALAGDVDDIFPADRRWHDPADPLPAPTPSRKEPN